MNFVVPQGVSLEKSLDISFFKTTKPLFLIKKFQINIVESEYFRKCENNMVECKIKLR